MPFFQLLDLCMPNFGLLNFNYSVLATAAIYPTEGERIALDVSGYTWDQVACCVRWMSAFAFAIREPSPIQIKNFHGEAPEDAHHLQNYVVDLAVLERATTRLAALADMRLRNLQDPSAQRAALPTARRAVGQRVVLCRQADGPPNLGRHAVAPLPPCCPFFCTMTATFGSNYWSPTAATLVIKCNSLL